MKILWIPQISSFDINGKMKLESDSNWVFAKSMIKSLFYMMENVDIKILLPIKYLNDNFDVNYEIPEHFYKAKRSLNHKIVNHLEIIDYPMVKNAIADRFNFDFERAKHIIEVYRPDILWINDPVKVMNWKMTIYMCQLSGYDVDPKIVSYNHWIDNELYSKVGNLKMDTFTYPSRDVSYMIRQLEGVLYSDLHLVNSKFAKSMLYESFFELFNIYYNYEEFNYYKFDNLFESVLRTKIRDLPPYAFDHNIQFIVPKKKNTILYNHRISPMKYYDDAFKRFVNICDSLYSYKNSIKVILTNPSGKKLNIDRPYFELYNDLNYEEYMRLICSCEVAVGTFLPGNGGMWSISMLETMLMGLPTFIPKHSGYKELTYGDYQGYYDSDQELLTKLIKVFMNEVYKKELSNEAKMTRNKYSFESIGSKILKYFKEANIL